MVSGMVLWCSEQTTPGISVGLVFCRLPKQRAEQKYRVSFSGCPMNAVMIVLEL